MTTTTVQLRIPAVHVVGIGASAGGLEPIEEFFQNMPADSGAAFIVIQHLSRDFDSMMESLLARHTDMPIHVATMGTEVEANNIYLNSAGQNVIVSGGRLMVTELLRSNALHLPIDIFLNSLALDYGPRATAVILSGAGTDGSRGVRAVQHAKGQVLVQDPASAGFDGMPRSSMGSAVSGAIMAPAKMPEQIIRYIKEGPSMNVAQASNLEPQPPFVGTALAQLLYLLQQRFHINFSAYKPTTMERRVERRMSLTQFNTLDEYVAHLKQNQDELDLLYRDILVDVTHFFRDESAFDFVAEEVIAKIVSEAEPNSEIRLWVAGCASGEEAYSFGILLLEELEKQGSDCMVRIFATDAHQESIDRAALGVFEPRSCAAVSQERLARFFTPVKDGYQVIKPLRDIMIFAHQDLLNSSPFTKLDLVSCRNVMIYLDNDAQQLLLSNFHFALKTDGILFLGPSEHLGELEDEFGIVDRKWRVFRKLRDVILPDVSITPPKLNSSIANQSKLIHQLPAAAQVSVGGPGEPTTDGYQEILATKSLAQKFGRAKPAEWMEPLLTSLIPSGLVLDQRSDIIYIFGDAQRYLHLRLGYGTLNALELLDGDVVTALRLATAQILSGQEKVIINQALIRTTSDEDIQVQMTVVSLGKSRNRPPRLFVGFTPLDVGESAPPKVIEMGAVPIEQVEQLQYELAVLRTTLQTSIEEQETTNEELSAANEELQASNEELSATNEELFTVNTEYQRSIAELSKLATDLENLQNSTNIGVLFLDSDMAIRQFTPPAGRILGLVDADVGRSINRLTFFNLSVDNAKLEAAVEELLAGTPASGRYNTISDSKMTDSKITDSKSTDSNVPAMVEIETALWNDRYYLLRVQPYINEEKAVEGVVITVIDISERRMAEAKSQDLNRQMRTITDNIPVRIVKVAPDMTIQFANRQISDYQGVEQDSAIGMPLQDLLGKEAFESYQLYIDIVLQGRTVNFDLERTDLKTGNTLYETATLIPDITEDGTSDGFFAYVHDVTKQEYRVSTEQTTEKESVRD